MNDFRDRREYMRELISRRRLLVMGAAAGVGLAVQPNIAALAQTPKKGGRLRIGMSQGGPTDTLDAHRVTNQADFARAFNLYDLLAWPNAETFELEMRLAESAEPNKAGDEWTVRLRKGVTFHNGKSLGADDLMFTVRRMMDPQSKLSAAAMIAYVDAKGMTKLDDRTVRFKLPKPNAEFLSGFATTTSSIVPADFDPANPVGTGPFKYKSFTPGDRSLFVANTSFWGGGPFVDELEIIDIADETARVNALLGGQVDAIASIPYTRIATVEGDASFKLLRSETGGWRPFTMRTDAPPFDNPKVREAMRLVVDREQMVEQALLGEGRVGNDLYNPFDPDFAKDLPQRKQDIERAKALLKEAGHDTLDIELVTAPVNAGVVEASQVLVEQAKAAGINIKLRKLDPSSFFGPDYLKYTFAVDNWSPTNSYLVQVAQADGPGAVYNETHFNDPEFNDLFSKAQQEVDAAKRKELIQKMQKIQYERGGYIIWGFANQIDAYSSKLAGFRPDRNGLPLTSFEFERVFFT
ncbi:ABC transporter substrate-binding protein [Mesorhizobium sp. CA8]|uniref:ABC transporter substrate-binding protein n=1 Tax=unclassified Mesorhizobium TaxID=325217 RepID=UPI001CCDA0C8|nr:MULTISPECIES: ABC transporter substrate-binding protein [unclassified Mesorhizobium]MBZ9761686.1 ABC transporter substrate-binding protein [Mesorhizobium sp. CA8]MBZ9820560.1 ABC transporter substrate-binding protein [Mesorhizobium sp. CA4]